MVKARVVRHRRQAAPLKAHLRYLQREGVTSDREKPTLFGPGRDTVDGAEFAGRCKDDRHHFRFIVSPEDAVDMEDLNCFTRDLMNQVERDLGTSLDWVGATHWNTEHPHVHVIIRGVTDLGEDLVMSRDYIKEGLRSRAQAIVTEELGPRTDADIKHALHRQVDAERFTQLDRQLIQDARRFEFVDLAPDSLAPDAFQALKAGRVRKLESLGLADQFAPGQWVLSERTEPVLRELGERGDIIKRIHRGLTDLGVERALQAYASALGMDADIITGRLLARGLDDELNGTAFVIVDGVDGRTHHVVMPSLEATSDAAPGAIVSLRKFDRPDGARLSLRVESDLDLESQVMAQGATWLDRQLVASTPEPLATNGFGMDVQSALKKRQEQLTELGLTDGPPDDLQIEPGLLAKLRQRELVQVAHHLAGSEGRPVHFPIEGATVNGVYRRRLNLASGRFAVLDDGMGFQLVPWSPKIDQYFGEPISGIMRSRGSVAWDLGRSKTKALEM